MNAVNSKKITQSRLDESVIRILTTKFKHGILTQEDLTVWEQPNRNTECYTGSYCIAKGKKKEKRIGNPQNNKKIDKNKSKK